MLALLSERPLYGYAILQRVHEVTDGKIQWTASKLYPLLHRLENQGLVEAFWQASESGPDRKYYRLTASGKTALSRARRDWMDLNAILARLWGPEPSLSST